MYGADEKEVEKKGEQVSMRVWASEWVGFNVPLDTL